MSIEELKPGNRRKEVSGVRSMIAMRLVMDNWVSVAEVARRVSGFFSLKIPHLTPFNKNICKNSILWLISFMIF